jgi:hypothetical protein
VIFTRKTRKLERLDFVVAGAQKSGTTALHYFLSKHPDILLPDKQELHFFDTDPTFSKTVDFELLHRHFHPRGDWVIAGECTPSYIYWKPAIERIWKYNRQMKFVVLLRNPIDRAFAHWNMQRHKGREPLDFLDAVKAEQERTAKPGSVEARQFSYIARGFYSEQIERVFKFFPRKQVLAIRFENFKNEKQKTLDSIFIFLGVESLGKVRDKDRNIVPYEREITPDERKYLYAIFGWDIAKLEEILGWDCSAWKA